MKKVALLTVLLVSFILAQGDFTFDGIPDPATAGQQYTITITANEGTGQANLRLVVAGQPKTFVRDTIINFGGTTTWTGPVEFTYAGSGVRLRCVDPNDGDVGDSDPFNTIPGPSTKWQITAPGQTADPGTPTGKSGSASVTAGDTETYDVNLCDVWYNVVDPNPLGFIITSNNPFYRVTGTNNVELRTASPPNWTVTVSGGSYASDESSVKVNPSPATQLLIICGGEDGLAGDTAQYGGKSGEPLRASLGTPYPVKILTVDKCWNRADYDDPHVNVYAGTVDLTDTTTDAISGGIADNVQVIFKVVNTSGEYIGAQGSKGLKTAYDTRVFVDPGVDSLVAYFDKPIVPIEVTSTLNIEAYVAGDPLESGFAMVQLVDGPPESFNIGAEGTIDTLVRIIDGKGSIDAWATAETTYTIRVTAGEQTKDLALTVQELKKLLVAPNPYKYSVHGDIPINFIYKVEQIGQGGASEVVLLIADPFGNIVYRVTYDLSAPQTDPGQQTIPWDRTNSKGNRIASGMYQAVLKITLINGETKVLKKNFMVIW